MKFSRRGGWGVGFDELHSGLDQRKGPFAVLRLILVSCLTMVWGAAWADPEPFRLDQARSTVGFTYYIGQAPTQGSMPVARADIALDLVDLSKSRVAVDLDARRTKAGFVFATQAVRGPQMLDVDRFPAIRFVSSQVKGRLPEATVKGTLTVRGVSRPVTLTAQLLRQAGQAKDDLSKLTVRLTGRIDRRDFGVKGFLGQVGPFLDITVNARVLR